MKNYQMKNDDWEIMKNAYEKLNRETEQYTIFMTNKSNELSEFIDAVIESTYAVDKMMNEEMLKKKNCNQQNDIKFEIIDDSFFKLKKKILDFVKLQKGIQNKLIKQFDEVNQSNENYNTEIKKLKDTNNTLFKDNEKLNDKVTELTKNLDTFNHSYENLKDVYTKLYGDYQMFTDKNERYVNDTQAYITKMIGKFENLIPIDNNKDELTQNELLKKCISTLIEKYKDLQEESNTLKQKTQKITNEKEDREKKLKEEVNKVKEENESLKKKYENDINKQKEITLDKIKQITSLLDESKKIISHYEEENKELKNENEKCTYRYKMLLLAQNQPEYFFYLNIIKYITLKMNRDIFILSLVGLIWGVTNHFIAYFNNLNKKEQNEETVPFYIKIKNMLIKNKISLCLFLLNQSGSLLNLLCLGKMNVSLTTIVTNSVSFITSRIVEFFHLKKKITSNFIIGFAFMMLGLSMIAMNSTPINNIDKVLLFELSFI